MIYGYVSKHETYCPRLAVARIVSYIPNLLFSIKSQLRCVCVWVFLEISATRKGQPVTDSLVF
jgi:hypothetical protein